ncbi:Hypothetical predicted protein [Podarcis lilfordi]|uniref:Uncharacterized protein n=1 Tax=Podarcis lilfordi TaxID=74358 RepID=A0AA35PPM1_9SAUR|nr:Hypothetical predicted protein [Podarcis lilfordi]
MVQRTTVCSEKLHKQVSLFWALFSKSNVLRLLQHPLFSRLLLLRNGLRFLTAIVTSLERRRVVVGGGYPRGLGWTAAGFRKGLCKSGALKGAGAYRSPLSPFLLRQRAALWARSPRHVRRLRGRIAGEEGELVGREEAGSAGRPASGMHPSPRDPQGPLGW